MQRFKAYFLLSCLFLLKSFSSHAQANTEIFQLLKKYLPEAEIETMEAKDHFSEAYKILLPQPLDHHNPKAGQFRQLIYLQHTNRKKPVVFETEGYAARFRTNELSRILQGNLIIVEYRYADPKKWIGNI